MKTVVYQIPVEPVEEKEGENKTSEALDKINNQAYHLANRAITLFLNYLYPEPDKELLELKDARQAINHLEQEISVIYKNQTAVENKEEVERLMVEKKMARNAWEGRVPDCKFYKHVKETVQTEFPDFPELLRKRLLRKVALDWLYSWMNQHAGNGFAANFPFYKHGSHLPLCHNHKEIRWIPSGTRAGVAQYTLRWLNSIRLKTTFTDHDKRLPKVLELLYSSDGTPDVRNRRLHDTLQPTLKLAGTKWSVHIPVLEDVSPVVTEQEEPLHIVFGFHHPICYAYGTNHAKPLGIDSGNYVRQQMKEFDKRIQKIKTDTKDDETIIQKKINKVKVAGAAYVEALQTKAVKAIVELAKKGQKNMIRMEQWPVPAQEQKQMPGDFRKLAMPYLCERLLRSISQWNFASFYKALEEEAGKYKIYLDFFTPQWNFYKLYTRELTYTDKKAGKKLIKTLHDKQRIPFEYHSSEDMSKQDKKQEGYLMFKFNQEFNDAGGLLTLYSSPRHRKRKTNEYVYRIHLDLNMAMSAAIAFKKGKNHEYA